jgi:protocatechuate 3,4-dioxygenase beta subunit
LLTPFLNGAGIDLSLSRREMLGLIGTAATALFVGCGRGQARSAESHRAQTAPASAIAAMPSCVVRPEQTEGPYFVDEKLNRSDIRSDPVDGSVKPGVPLRLTFDVTRVDGANCAPLAGAILDVWQCDALGVYSGVRDRQFDTSGKKFLRGFQTTNAGGTAGFLTIYPGWYPGRAVHIHFKIRIDPASRRAYEFTSQLYFDESVTNQIHGQPPYNSKQGRRTANEADFLFRRGGKQLMPALTKDAQGYAAKFGVGLQIS